MSVMPELDKYIQTVGGNDLYIVMKGDANKFNFKWTHYLIILSLFFFRQTFKL